MNSYAGEPKSIKPLNEQLYSAGVWENFTLTHAGSLLGGLDMSGSDPTGLGERDRKLYAVVQRGLYQSMHPSLVVSQYYWHFGGSHIALKERSDPRSDLLSKRRMAYLNDRRGLNGSRLFWLVECPPADHLNKLLSVSVVKHLFLAPFERESRVMLLEKLKHRNAWLAEERELERQKDLLDKSLKELASRAEIISPQNKTMSVQEMWALHRALVNMNPHLLKDALREEVPVEQWDELLSTGSIRPVEVNGMTCLKFGGAKTTYARIASIIGYGTRYVHEGIWIHSNRSPLMQRGNYLVVNRWVPISKAGLSVMLRNKANEIARQNMKLTALFKGDNPNSEMEAKVEANKHLKARLEELDDAAESADRYGFYNSHVVMFNDDPEELKKQCQEMETALSESSLRVVWESAGLMQLFPTLLPGYAEKSPRAAEFTTSQAGAASIAYKSHPGIAVWGDRKEEATYVLESRDGCAFNFVEFIADKGLVVGTGPTRAGKTFMKNCMAAHFMKFGGLYQDIGVDDGAEPLAAYFGEDAGLFKIDDPASSKGFAAFTAADPERGALDGQFITHLLRQIRMMLSLNDARALQELSAEEQAELDDAIMAILRIDPSLKQMRTLSSLHNHVSKSLKAKLARWVGNGALASLFDNVEDGIGDLKKRIQVYNLSGLKDNHRLAGLAQSEIFYRVTKLFEDPRWRDRIKQLQIDECQYFLEVPGAVEFLVAKARTWNKWSGGISLWTQSPKHYEQIPDWGMLRSAATTFIFGAEPKMDSGLKADYKRVYGLSDGQVDAIASLTPRKEMFIWQREADVSKVVVLNAEKEQYAIATSRPTEAIIVRELLKQYPHDPEYAIDLSVKKLEEMKRGKLEN